MILRIIRIVPHKKTDNNFPSISYVFVMILKISIKDAQNIKKLTDNKR